MNKVIPFPQANDLDKIISIINVDDLENLKDDVYVSVLLGRVKPRQVNYYIAACQYLGLLKEDKTMTYEGHQVRNATGIDQQVKLAVRIFKKEVFAKAYLQNADANKFMEILKDYYPSYSEPMLKRRSQSAIAWMKRFRPKHDFVNKSSYELFRDEAISTVFFSNLLYGYELDRNEILDIIEETHSLDSPEYIMEKVSQIS